MALTAQLHRLDLQMLPVVAAFPGISAGHPSWSGQHSTRVFMVSLLPLCLWPALATMTLLAPLTITNAPNYNRLGFSLRRT